MAENNSSHAGTTAFSREQLRAAKHGLQVAHEFAAEAVDDPHDEGLRGELKSSLVLTSLEGAALALGYRLARIEGGRE